MLSLVSCLFLLCVDARVICSHACHALLRSMCLYAFRHVLCLDLHLYMHIFMLICLNLVLHILVCLDLRSTCFMPSFMCLCALCHVFVPRPRLCLSCHVQL